ncbi:MAG: hypothetical protein MK025_06055 [Acidobacteriia bacterium]|nr:hypothetical protein [Terriglobia bacterium]
MDQNKARKIIFSAPRKKRELVDRRTFMVTSAVIGTGLLDLGGCSDSSKTSWELQGKNYSVRIDQAGGFKVYKPGGLTIWQNSQSIQPQVLVTARESDNKTKLYRFEEAADRETKPFIQGQHRGVKTKLSSFSGTDVEIEIIQALDSENDELLVRIEQTGGMQKVLEIKHFYHIEKPTVEGGYLLVPHGSGYLIPAEMAEPMPKSGSTDYQKNDFSARGNLVGGRYSLPLFGLAKQNHSLYQIVETFWDCSVEVDHIPGKVSSIDFNWISSLGTLGYARQFLMRFAQDLDYVGMAKAYRRYAQKQGLFKTLKEKEKKTPAIKRYLQGIEYRSYFWDANNERQVLRDIRRWRSHNLAVNFFFPKWSSGTGGKDGANSWQAFLREEPISGGWKRLNRFVSRVRREGALIKVFINPNAHLKGAPGYNSARSSVDRLGKLHPRPSFWGDGLSPEFGPDALRQALDFSKSKGFGMDALYFDGFAFHGGHKEDFSSQHRVSRRRAIEKQIECFRETRQRGIMPGAELARFWCASSCDFFFFTDWSRDRLPVGEPVPLFQLVFHECYAACFSGGGYGTYDWPEDKNPRLYELLFASAPAYNWMLPYRKDFPGLAFEGGVPIKDWETKEMDRRIEWLKRWSAYFQKVVYSEMVSHEFLNQERTLQKIQYSNGVRAEFDMNKGLCRIYGVDGFSGDWEKPHKGTF